jgi:hypothetical protein
MDDDLSRLQEVWRSKTPVVFRQAQGRLRVRLPFSAHNRSWLAAMGRHNPEWISAKKYWEIPAAWFNKLVERALDSYGFLYVIQPYREQEKCARACMEAQGHECNCSCMGANHGQGNMSGWLEISETFATRWNEAHLACRLLRKRDM